MKTKMTLIASMLLTLFTAAPTSAFDEAADDIKFDQASLHTDETIAAYADRGWYVQMENSTADWLEEGDFLELPLHLTAGTEIIFRGVGDDDALDLDLVVLGPDCQLIASDVDVDATPYVKFVVPRTGTYTVVLKLAAGVTDGSYVAILGATR